MTTSAGERITVRLRQQIVRGRWAPGAQLPARDALAQELNACQATLQVAVKRLIDEGFLEVGPRKMGTRVAACPPHLSRYRLIFPFGPDDWGQFWRALEAAARQRTAPGREFLCFYGLGGHRDIAEYEDVVSEARSRRIAGLIFASSADELLGTPLIDQPGIPRAAVAGEGKLPGVPKVGLDLDGFIDQAVRHLLERGRRRIAILCANHAQLMHVKFRAAMATHGLEPHTRWEHFASARNPMAARHIMELLLQPGRQARPDGLIIADDNLITAATEGLVAAGARVPEDVSVVALTNFPNLLPSAVPLTRIGFDIPALLDLLILRLQQSARGEAPPEYTILPAVTQAAIGTNEPPAKNCVVQASRPGNVRRARV